MSIVVVCAVNNCYPVAFCSPIAAPKMETLASIFGELRERRELSVEHSAEFFCFFRDVRQIRDVVDGALKNL